MSGKNDKQAFDEQTLARVLEAAYVLQEHNRLREREARHPEKVIATAAAASGPIPASAPAPLKSVAVEPVPTVPKPTVTTSRVERKPSAKGDYSVVLGQIVETQQKIQADHLELEYAMLLIAERATEIAQAEGAGIGLLNNGKVRYAAAAGSMALPIETEVPVEKALSSACLRVGQVVRCSDVSTEFLVDLEECRRRGIQSMIAAPIHHSSNVVGALELYYGTSEAFTEPDVHTCQLMAGLVAESLARSEERGTKRSRDAEPASVRDAVETRKVPASSQPAEDNQQVSSARPFPSECRKCGNDLVPDEQFCGECGWPSGSDYQGGIPPSKPVSVWKSRKPANPVPANGAGVASPSFLSEEDAEEFLRKQLPQLFTHLGGENTEAHAADETVGLEALTHSSVDPLNAELETTALAHADAAPATIDADWSSAASAREFLEQVAKRNRRSTLGRFLRARRGDIYLAVAVILISVVIRWGIWSSTPLNTTSNSATAAHHKPGADLPLYDRILISLGLAEAPPPPEYKGNPDTQVWVDVQTALYYCPGTDLYGKTPKGRLTTQRDAQLDSFEPASRKACD